MTAGNGIFASNLVHVTVENRGASWSIGGQYNWRKYLTLPNILKEFNPNLYGYSLKDGLSTERSSRFNVAELAAMSRDMPYMAKVLVKRLQHDPKVNMTHDWKLVTLFIGNNDFCTDICFYPKPELTVSYHERNMLKTYRYLRDHVPRLLLNVVPAPNLRFLANLSGLPPVCYSTLRFECPCLLGKTKAHLDYYEGIMKRWIAKDYEIVNMPEFNTDVSLQRFRSISDTLIFIFISISFCRPLLSMCNLSRSLKTFHVLNVARRIRDFSPRIAFTLVSVDMLQQRMPFGIICWRWRARRVASIRNYLRSFAVPPRSVLF